MNIPILGPQPKRLAREIVVAPRMPRFDPSTYRGAFDAPTDVVMDCDTPRDGKPCGWHAIGPRSDVKKAYDDHRRLYHSQDIGIVLLNMPNQ